MIFSLYMYIVYKDAELLLLTLLCRAQVIRKPTYLEHQNCVIRKLYIRVFLDF